MEGFANVFRNLDWSVLTDTALRVLPALICITLHELAHGYTAYKLGDNTARMAGRLTLNPLKHIDPWGLVMMVLFRFGWAKPVPVDMRHFDKPRQGMAITALAGPVSNLLIGAVCLFLYGLLYGPLYLRGTAFSYNVLQMVMNTAFMSLSLAVFNLLPISPLDGSKVLFAFLSDSAYEKLMRYERYGMLIVMVLVISGGLSGYLSTVTAWIYDKLFFIAEFAFELVN